MDNSFNWDLNRGSPHYNGLTYLSLDPISVDS